MKALKVTILSLIGLAAVATIYFCTPLSDRTSCNGDHATVHCYAKSAFPRFVADDFDGVIPEAFGTIKSQGCHDLPLAKDALYAATSLIPSNVHMTEETVEFIDDLLTDDPECFLKAVKDMPLEPFLETPEYKETLEFLMKPVTDEDISNA